MFGNIITAELFFIRKNGHLKPMPCVFKTQQANNESMGSRRRL